jgi:lipid A 3-O-deacylase
LYRFELRKILTALLVVGVLPGVTAIAQEAAPVVNAAISAATGAGLAANPAPAESSPASRRWEFGPFVNYGNGVGDRSDYHFFAVGFQAGRMMTPIVHAGPFTGRFELGGNVMPLFQAYTPAPFVTYVQPPNTNILVPQQNGGGTFTGASITPVVFRWDFKPESRRVMPWFQAQAGVLYTTHKFPPTVEVPEGTPGGTSVWNFRSGGGIGFHYFIRPRRSVDFALNAEHISSASLGDKNPGVNASLQFQVGYTWWK